MKIKKLSENRVKVLIESQDIARYRVPYHRLNTADEHSAEFIYLLLVKIKEQTGISFLECSVLLEASPACGGNYYITVTGGPESDGWQLRKEGGESEECRIFSPRRLQDLGRAIKIFDRFPFLRPEGSALYKYGGTYYCVLDFSPVQMAHKEFDLLILQLSEFMTPCKGSAENEGVLLERGTLISPLLIKNE